VPGTELGSWTLTNLPPYGPSETVSTIRGISGVSLTAGDSYFLAVAPLDFTTIDFLSDSNPGATGLFYHPPAYPTATQGELPAFDVIGNAAVTLNNPPPTVNNVTSSTASGTYGAGSSISIQVIFSAAVMVTGIPQLALNSGGTANYSSGSGSTTLNFTYTVGASDSSAHLNYASASALTVNGGTIQDASSNNANLTLPALGAAGSLGANTNIFIGMMAPAGSAAYTYTGNYFTSLFGSPGVSKSNSVSASLTFSAPLPANFTGDPAGPVVNDSILPVSWTITDGVHTFSSASGNLLDGLALETNVTGLITSWGVIGCSSSGCNNGDLTTMGESGGSIDEYAFQYTGTSGDLATVFNDPGTWTATLNGFTGGTSSTPAYLTGGGSVAVVTGTIGGVGSAAYYGFYWGGGAFSASASIINANAGASYLLSEGAVGGSCSGGGTATLNSGDNFTGTIAIANLAPGFYCIGVDANNSSDPAVALTFNTPVTASPVFFAGQTSLGSGVEYLAFPNSTVFGYYTFVASSIFYHYDMGYEAFVAGSASDVYLYDFASGHWWYTSNTLFPYLYDFTLKTWIYYFPNTMSPGHYTSNPRYFSNLTTGQIFTM
jgi:hypothetical protein